MPRPRAGAPPSLAPQTPSPPLASASCPPVALSASTGAAPAAGMKRHRTQCWQDGANTADAISKRVQLVLPTVWREGLYTSSNMRKDVNFTYMSWASARREYNPRQRRPSPVPAGPPDDARGPADPVVLFDGVRPCTSVGVAAGARGWGSSTRLRFPTRKGCAV